MEMNGQQKSFLLSILLHIVIGSICILSVTQVRPIKMIVIDLMASPAGAPWEETPARGVKVDARKAADRRKPAQIMSRSFAQSGPLEAKEKVPAQTHAHLIGNVSPTSTPASVPEVAKTLPASAESRTPDGNSKPGEPINSGNTVAGGGAAGLGNFPEQLRIGYLKEHFAYIKNIIQGNITYPPRARRMGWSGKVVVSFVIDERGLTSNEKIVESSGFDILDGNVIDTIRAVTPFPCPPVKAELRIPIIYRLE